MISIGGDMITPNAIFKNSGEFVFSGEKIVLNTLCNLGKTIVTGKKLSLDIKNIYGLENITLDNVEELTFIGIESPINLPYIEHYVPKLSKLTIESCPGLSSTRENLISCDHVLSKKSLSI